MRRQGKKKRARSTFEEAKLNEFMENIAPRLPTLKIYRLEPDGKQKLLTTTFLEFFSYEELREQFGGGRFLVRSVRSNGTYGPSRVVDVEPPRSGYKR